MFGKTKIATDALPERVSYTKYYEHDGMLRAYANRSMLLAMVFGVIALTSLGFGAFHQIGKGIIHKIGSDAAQRVCAASDHTARDGARAIA